MAVTLTATRFRFTILSRPSAIGPGDNNMQIGAILPSRNRIPMLPNASQAWDWKFLRRGPAPRLLRTNAPGYTNEEAIRAIRGDSKWRFSVGDIGAGGYDLVFAPNNRPFAEWDYLGMLVPFDALLLRTGNDDLTYPHRAVGSWRLDVVLAGSAQWTKVLEVRSNPTPAANQTWYGATGTLGTTNLPDASFSRSRHFEVQPNTVVRSVTAPARRLVPRLDLSVTGWAAV